ncbi:ribonuclease H-like domain, reverse transcriptase, RNA-dependent DNA polymerase [Tanacetum coccineum]|uniref:Ribonuclease H-like domain, reverse transcriptase, RNA-dependent DNA polymerase n=1 Tax=Tanacetum coccineum TaxID=301880 RepID=A0ABQ5BLY4_9ASTR
MHEVISFYKGLEMHTRQILNYKGAIPTMTAANARVAIQEMAKHSQKWHDGMFTRTRINEKVNPAQVRYELCNGSHYTKDCPLKEEGKTLKEAYYTQLGVPFQQGGQYRAAAPGFYQRNNGNPLYQERRQTMEETLSKFMAKSAKRHEENSNLIKEIRASTDVAIRNQGASIKALEIQIGQMSKVLQERGSRNLPSSTETNPRYHVKSISATFKIDTTLIRRIGPSQYAVSGPQNSKLFFMPSQATIPFPSHLYDDCYDEEEGLYEPKDFDAYSIGTTLLDDALPPKEKDTGSFTLPCIINNLCFNKALADLGSSVSVMPFSTYTKLRLGELAHTKLIVELANRTVKRPKGIVENILVEIDKFVFPLYFIVPDKPKDIKTPLILGRPFLSTAHAKIDVFKRKITLRVGNDKVEFKNDKPTSNIIKRVYALSLRERMELDLEARLMGEALILNRSLDPLYGDYIKLNDLNEPLELRRNQVDDLEPTIKEGEVVDEPKMDIVKTRCDNEIIVGLDDYPSYCDFDRKIHIDCAFNLQFSCMIRYEHINANFFPLLSINVMSKNFYNSVMKDKIEYKGKNVVGDFMNIPIFVGNFYVMIDFAVVENMDSYRDERMGDIIVGRPFCKDACIKARRFDGMITIYKGNDSVTYQMAQSHPRFKHLTNAQCNKMRPLLKVSAQYDLKGISYPYQKLKEFFKEVLNFGPEYIKDDKVEEWLTCGHESVHEME